MKQHTCWTQTIWNPALYICPQQPVTDLTTVTDMDSGKLFRLALAKGGDYADLYFQQTDFHDILLRDGEVNAAGTQNESGL